AGDGVVGGWGVEGLGGGGGGGVGGAARRRQPGHRAGPGLQRWRRRARRRHLGPRAAGDQMRGDSGFPVRIRFARHGKVRFIGARDVSRALERAFRVGRLPLAFPEAFSPRPKVSFGLALSVGHESDAEYLDVELTDAVDTEALADRLTPAMPEGMPVTGAVRLVERAPALQESITEVQ